MNAKRLSYLISVLVIISVLDENIARKYEAIIKNIWFVANVLLVVEIEPMIYNFFGI